MPLTDIKLKNLKPAEKAYKAADQYGLYVYVPPTGKRVFRINYRYEGKNQTATLGRYPEMSLQQARVAALKFKESLRQGVDPHREQRKERLTQQLSKKLLFQALADEWFQSEEVNWVDGHYRHVKERLNKHVLPYLKDRPVTEITMPELVEITKRIAVNSVDIAHRAASDIKRILTIAQIRGDIEHNPAQNLTKALPKRKKQQHFAAVTDVPTFAQLVRSIDHAIAGPVNQTMLWMAPRLALRPGDLRKLRWEQINLEVATIDLEPEKTKNSTEVSTIVPLAKQVVEKLEGMKKWTGDKPYVFYSPTSSSGYPSDNTMNQMLVRLGWPRDVHSVHGFRAAAKTMLIEVLRFGELETELQLSHQVPDLHGRAYNRVHLIDERTLMMQVWADFIERLIEGRDYDDLIQTRK